MSTTQTGKPESLWNRLVAAIRRKDAEPAATSVAADSAIIIVDEAGKMLVDQNGHFIGSRRGSVI
jgi:hypothetical protein